MVQIFKKVSYQLTYYIGSMSYNAATHGTGIDIGNLAALVTKLKFVDGTGKASALFGQLVAFSPLLWLCCL